MTECMPQLGPNTIMLDNHCLDKLKYFMIFIPMVVFNSGDETYGFPTLQQKRG
jgi:hypothetical protein